MLEEEPVAVDARARMAEFQRDFASRLLGGDEGAATHVGSLAAQPGFAVYRNTVATACIDALAANFPTVVEIVGDEWFAAAALRFQRAAPPRDGCLAMYGEGFADFLAGFAPARELPYLADVARFDRFWTEAHLAEDAPVLTPDELGGAGDTAALAGRVFVPHPSARWATTPGIPAFTIWRRHRERADIGAELPWRAESALVVRPRDVVTWQPIAPAAAMFLTACRAGFLFADALRHAEEAAAHRSESSPASRAERVPASCTEPAPDSGGAQGDGRNAPSIWLPALLAAGAFCQVAAPPT